MNVNISFFYDDATDQLRYMESVLKEIKNGTQDSEKIGELFRAFHTLKGAASMFELADIVSLTHKAEDLLDKVRDEKVIFDSNLGVLFIEVKDMIETLVEQLMKNGVTCHDTKLTITKLEDELLKSMVTNIIPKVPKEIKIKKIEPKEIVKKTKTILVVDDASMIRNLAEKTAQAAGYNVITAQDGMEGLQKLRDNDIDLIFSDLNMPQMCGMDMVKEIRKDTKYQFLPIVMLTTEKKDELKSLGKVLGVKAWLVKPFNKNKLLTVLEKLLV